MPASWASSAPSSACAEAASLERALFSPPQLVRLRAESVGRLRPGRGKRAREGRQAREE